DLEGNKEYRLDAELRQLYPITVNSNMKDADVYIDNKYCGKTNDQFYLLVHDILPGDHTLRIECAGRRAEQQITVYKESLVFRCDVDTAQARPQYVVFEVVPKNASVQIDNKSYVPEDGVVQDLLQNGSYTYRVEAKDYHSESGSFVVSGSKFTRKIVLKPAHGWLQVSGDGALKGAIVYVDNANIGTAPIKSRPLSSGEHRVRIVKPMYKTFEASVTISDNETLPYEPTLEPDFATVSVNTELSECELWINNEKRGTLPWTGDLATGSYIFEVRKPGHSPSTITQTITTKEPTVTVNIAAPKPIYGTLNITSTPAMANVFINGKKVGTTPIMQEMVVGKYMVSVRKDGYSSFTAEVEVSEGQTKDVNAQLTQKTSTSSSSYKPTSSSTYSSSYSSSPSSTSKPSTYSSSSSSKSRRYTSKKQKKGGFNVGISLGGGYSMLGTTEGWEFNCGFMWRLWRHDSLLNAMTGVNYMRTFKSNFISVPLVVNLNYSRGRSGSMYAGLGVEPTMVLVNLNGETVSGMDASLVVNALGYGWRHSDFNFYLKYMFGCELLTVGCRYTYLF
ncbi:MAG: PEGA domain-containing protein, partial [Alistipes sp.]|nr:PEGA domain-containing protein [Alistipes sp.]